MYRNFRKILIMMALLFPSFMCKVLIAIMVLLVETFLLNLEMNDEHMNGMNNTRRCLGAPPWIDSLRFPLGI